MQGFILRRAGRRGGISALALVAMLGAMAPAVPGVGMSGAAQAQEHGDGHESGGGKGSGGQGSGGKGSGGSGGHEDGEDHDHEEGEDSHEGGKGPGGSKGGEGGDAGGEGQGQGQGNQGEDGAGGHGEDRGGGQQQGGAGNQPPWASEGIPEVELGRMNVARSPDHVLDRALAEALAQLGGMSGFYNLSLDQMLVALSTSWESVSLIDSPLQNLALFRDALDGQIDLSAYGIGNDRDTLMAAFVGIASDKTIPITTESVLALSVILDMPLSESEARAIAADAEAIRQAALAGHG